MATQKGRNWSSGDIVTAANLSSIERGVSAVAEEYTPTTWANGNTVTAAGLNNIEQGIANAGGGGSSDFSTAQVTVVNASSGGASIPLANADDLEGTPFAPASLGDVHIAVNETLIATAILYKGKTMMPNAPNLSVTGNASVSNGMLIITGDCTITISDSSGDLK